MLEVVLRNASGASSRAEAVLDSGSFFTIVRDDVLPKKTAVATLKTPRVRGMAGRSGRLRMTGEVVISIELEGKEIQTSAYVCPDLKRDLLIGATTMQGWDISVLNRGGKTRVVVGRDMNDPDLTGVDSVG